MPDADSSDRIEQLRARAPGIDEEDVYDDEEVEDLPEWWRDAIAEFDRYGLRPYRPPRFEDGVLTQEVFDDLERQLGIEIGFIGVDVRYKDDWNIRIDGEIVGEISRRRDPNGYTVYEMSSAAFKDMVSKLV